MNYKVSISFLVVFLLAIFNTSESFALKNSSEEENFTELIAELQKTCNKLKNVVLNKGFKASKKFNLDLENKLKDKVLLVEENLFNLCTKEDLDSVFTKKDCELLFNFLSEKYQAIIDINDYSVFKNLKSYIQNAKNVLAILENNNKKVEDLKKDNLKLESHILNLQKSISNLEVGLAVGAVACITYGIYQYYKKSDKK